jgi:hypothetical protein
MVHSTTDTDPEPYNFRVPLIPVDRLPHLALACQCENAGETFLPGVLFLKHPHSELERICILPNSHL